MVALTGVVLGDLRDRVAYVTVGLKTEHATGHVVAELFHLFSDVAEKSITGPSANHHNHVDWTFTEVHCHGCTRSDGHIANFVSFDAVGVLADRGNGGTQGYYHLGRSDVFEAAVAPDRRHWGIGGGTWVSPYAPDNSSPGSDWAEENVAGGPLGDDIHAGIFLLPLEGDGDIAGCMEQRARVEGEDATGEETYVADAEDGRTALFVLGDSEVLAGSAGIEECTDG
jgi:hypothetical protein